MHRTTGTTTGAALLALGVLTWAGGPASAHHREGHTPRPTASPSPSGSPESSPSASPSASATPTQTATPSPSPSDPPVVDGDGAPGPGCEGVIVPGVPAECTYLHDGSHGSVQGAAAATEVRFFCADPGLFSTRCTPYLWGEVQVSLSTRNGVAVASCSGSSPFSYYNLPALCSSSAATSVPVGTELVCTARATAAGTFRCASG